MPAGSIRLKAPREFLEFGVGGGHWGNVACTTGTEN